MANLAQNYAMIKKLILCFDSFMTIWLLTLPEKFKEWFDHYDNNYDEEIQDRAQFNFAERPNFPFFDKNDNTRLCKRENAKSWNFLPNSWILNKCYEFYYGQTALWMTKSIKYEINYKENDLDKKMPAKKKPPPNAPDNEEKEKEEKTTADKVSENINNEEYENKLIFKTKIKTQDDDENSDEREANCRMTPRKRPSATIFASERKGKRTAKKKKHTEEGLIAINPKVLKGQLQKFNSVINNIWNCAKEFGQYVEDEEGNYAKVVQDLKNQLGEIQKVYLDINKFFENL